MSSGGIGISAGDDGMFVWEVQNGLVRVSCKIHIGFYYYLALSRIINLHLFRENLMVT